MRLLTGALIAAMPWAASAEPIPDAHLQVSFNECVEACGPGHARAFCNEMCGCMTGEMSRHWDLDEFRARMQRVRADPEDEMVRDELDRLAQYCAARIGIE